jgi:hypothetical protein
VTPPDPSLRASDADREAVATQLRAAREDGRLDTEELEERLGQAYAAKTFGELAPLTADLAPAPASSSAAPAASSAPAPAPAVEENANWRLRWGSWAGTSVLLVGIWAIISIASGELTFFWPIFPIGFWALANVAGMFSGWGQSPPPPDPPRPPEPPRLP